jgi:hypothetical protein
MGRFEDILKKSAEKTDNEFVSDISSLTSLTDDEINLLFPQRADQEILLKLLTIVQGATDENNKIVALKTNIEELAGTAVRLIKYFV